MQMFNICVYSVPCSNARQAGIWKALGMVPLGLSAVGIVTSFPWAGHVIYIFVDKGILIMVMILCTWYLENSTTDTCKERIGEK